MERKQETWRIIYRFTTSQDPEGQYCITYVWANDRDDARRVFHSKFHSKFNNKYSDGTWLSSLGTWKWTSQASHPSSIGYEILQVDGGKPVGVPIESVIFN